MKTYLMRIAVAGLFAVSLSVAGTIFAEGTWAFPPKCPDCTQVTLECPGSPCNCTFDSSTQSYYCKPPLP